VTESISLHQFELPGGERPRSLILHDMRHSAIQLQQIEGRCHRDGQHAMIHYAFAEDTVEETITARVIARMTAMDGMAGDDISMFETIADGVEFGVRRRASQDQTQADADEASDRPDH
jgi:hypothetical protein